MFGIELLLQLTEGIINDLIELFVILYWKQFNFVDSTE